MTNTTKTVTKCISLLRERLSKLRMKQQAENCYLLSLPIEIIELIVENLPQYSQVFLSQTCTALRNLAQDTHGPSRVVSDAGRMEWLTVLNHDCTTKWVCEVCAKTHVVILGDYPACPYQTYHADYLGRGIRLGKFHLAYRHVQLALKYSRLPSSQLSERQRTHLDCITEGTCASQHWHRLTAAVDIRYWIQPMIINGRFLLYVRETAIPYDVYREVPYWNIHACPHQGYYPGERAEYIERREHTVQRRVARRIPNIARKTGWNIDMSNAQAVKIVTEDAREAYIPRSSSTWRMACAAEHAIRKPGREILLSCGLCQTDFALTVHREVDGQGNQILRSGVKRVTLRRWYDLGSECAPESLEWLAITGACRENGKTFRAPHDLPIGSIWSTYSA